MFLICAAVHAFLTGGSGGGAAHPSFITVGPSHEVTLNLSPSTPLSQLERTSLLRPLVPAAFPATCVSLEVRRQFRRPIPFPFPTTRVFAVFGVFVDPCRPVPRRPARAGCITTVRYRCLLTRMTCVPCVLAVSACWRWCVCVCDPTTGDRTATTTSLLCPL